MEIINNFFNILIEIVYQLLKLKMDFKLDNAEWGLGWVWGTS
jgi:hypothetical protein